jgi:hypothetical protein
MVWIKWDDYGKKPKRKKQAKKKKPRVEPPVKIIPGKHKAEFKRASELLKD